MCDIMTLCSPCTFNFHYAMDVITFKCFGGISVSILYMCACVQYVSLSLTCPLSNSGSTKYDH